MEIAQGIRVYYKNQKNFQNVVFFADDSYKYYPTGGMLFEVCSESSLHMITQKVQQMITLYPDGTNELSAETITDMFKWLYGTIEDKKLPVATELFRSGFSEEIFETLEHDFTLENSVTVREFFDVVYENYAKSVLMLFDLFVATAAHWTGIADEFQQEALKTFEEYADCLYEEYSKKCSVRSKNGHKQVETNPITNFVQLLIFEHCSMKKERDDVKICENCGSFFIPPNRNNTIFCTAPSPQNPKKTCQEIGPRIKRDKKRRENDMLREHNATLSKYRMALKRELDRANEHSKPNDPNKENRRVTQALKKLQEESDRIWREKNLDGK